MSLTKPLEPTSSRGIPRSGSSSSSCGHMPLMSPSRNTSTMLEQASIEIAWACVIADAARTSSAEASANANGMIRISEPLPLSRSPLKPTRCCNAMETVRPQSKTRPSIAYSPLLSHARYRSRISSVLTCHSLAISESNVASIMLVSSDHVPIGWLCVPYPVIPSHRKVSLGMNS